MFGFTRPVRALVMLPLFAALVWTAGCGGGKSKTESVSGKVTLEGKPVSGEITFVCSDGKEIKSPLAPDGGYSILNPAKGDAKIGVKSMGSAPPPTAGTKADITGMPAGGAGVPPPAKYGNPASSGLTYPVKGGEETHNIDLKP